MCSIATKFFGKRLTSSFYCDIISMLNFTQVKLYEPLAQAAEHLPFKQGVPGSIPGWLTNGPLVKRLRHRPFTAESWVRFPYGSPSLRWTPSGVPKPNGDIAQLVRAFASHARGHGFESPCLHQISIVIWIKLRWIFYTLPARAFGRNYEHS